MISLINEQEKREELSDLPFPDADLNEKEAETIELYCAKVAGFFQLVFNQASIFPVQAFINGKANAIPLGTITIDETGKASINQ